MPHTSVSHSISKLPPPTPRPDKIPRTELIRMEITIGNGYLPKG